MPEPAPEPAPEAAAEFVAVAPEPEPEPLPAPEAEPLPAPSVETAVAEAVAAPEWRDEVSYTLAPGGDRGQTGDGGRPGRPFFEWTANGGALNFDTHGDGSGNEISYEQGRAVPEQAGELTAAFTGNHGWFWRNGRRRR